MMSSALRTCGALARNGTSGSPPRDATRDDAATGFALAARDGDRQAAEQFVRLLHLDVWRFVAHLSADPQSADDLTQDTFVRALRSLPGFQGRSSARSWLLTIARRTVIDSLRSAAARPRTSGGEDWQAAIERGQYHPPGFEEGVVLADLLDLLPAERRDAFVLTQLVGVPYAEAADTCDCPIGTVRSRVARARATLTDLVRQAEREVGALPGPGERDRSHGGRREELARAA